MPKKKPVRKRKTKPIEFPKTEWKGKVIDLIYKRPGGHISRFLANPRYRERLKGKQATGTSKVVKEFAKKFPGKDKRMLRKLAAALRRFTIIEIPMGDLKYFYARRTAEDIIHTRTVVSLTESQVMELGLHIHGCIDHALAAIGVLRAKGIKASFVRESDHAWVLVEMNQKKYRVDPSYTTRLGRPVMEITPAMEKSYQRKIEAGEMAIGRDAWDVGIFSLEDYAKYEAKLK